MADWSDNSVILENEERIYGKFMDKLGTSKIDHSSLILFGNPVSSEFLKKISISKHLFTASDRLSKIAFKFYGDAELWWVLAWFNGKPTDFHCKVGDTILIPHPVEEAILRAQEREGI